MRVCATSTQTENTYSTRSKGGTHPDCISIVRNRETLMRSDGVCVSRRTVMKAEFLSGKGFLKKRMPSAERQQEVITGRIGQYPTERLLTWGGGSPKDRCKSFSVLMEKLDTSG